MAVSKNLNTTARLGLLCALSWTEKYFVRQGHSSCRYPKGMTLEEVANDTADAITHLDASRKAFGSFQPGVGPCGEPQLVNFIAEYLNGLPKYRKAALTKRTPDLLVPGEWALEFKIVRPFGDNAREAENWSVNLLHPYPGNVSSIGDCLKLLQWTGREQRAVIVIGYEHIPQRIDLTPLVKSFELIAEHVMDIHLSARVECRREGLIHPVHQALRLFAWQVGE